MVAIMESQVEEMRRLLSRFKVGATPQPGIDSVSSGGYNRPNGGSPNAADGLPPHADILVFGPSGSGKSSLIRTFWMALHRSQQVPADFADRIIVKDTAMNEGTLKYVSAVVKPASRDGRGQGSSAIVCHDTRGHIWMDEREQRQLGVILDGNVKDDSIVQQRNYRYARLLWEFWKRDVDLFPPEILLRRNGLGSQPHALLFVFDGSMDDVPDGTTNICHIPEDHNQEVAKNAADDGGPELEAPPSLECVLPVALVAAPDLLERDGLEGLLDVAEVLPAGAAILFHKVDVAEQDLSHLF